MYFRKGARPIAPTSSSGTLSAPRVLDVDDRASNGAANAELASNGASVTAEDIDGFRNEIPASNVLLMKPAMHRKQYAYLIPYARLCEMLGFEGDDEHPLVLQAGQLQQVMRTLLRAVHVDEDWYFRQYPDVRDAVTKGIFRSAKHHFVESGYFEGRKPARVVVDEDWYGRTYPDVGESVEFGELRSCQEHFDRYGEKEGRLPAED